MKRLSEHFDLFEQLVGGVLGPWLQCRVTVPRHHRRRTGRKCSVRDGCGTVLLALKVSGGCFPHGFLLMGYRRLGAGGQSPQQSAG